MREVVIVDSVRTGLAKSFRGKFNLTRPDNMAAHCVDACWRATTSTRCWWMTASLAPAPTKAPRATTSGATWVLSGLGIQVPGMTLNRYCSSGLQAIAIAANRDRFQFAAR